MSSILTNSSAMVALQTLKGINSSLSKTQNEISTGKSVATAKDNAAVWAISKVMESDVSGFESISNSLSLGESTVAVARNAAETITDLLGDMKDKIIAAQGDNVDRTKLQSDVDALKEQIASVVGAAQFNGLNLLDGSTSSTKVLSSLDRSGTSVSAAYIDVTGVDFSSGGYLGVDVFSGSTAGASATGDAAAVNIDAGSSGDLVIDATNLVEGDKLSVTIAGKTATYTVTADDMNATAPEENIAFGLKNAVDALGIEGLTVDYDDSTTSGTLNFTNDGTDDLTLTAQYKNVGSGDLALLDTIDVTDTATLETQLGNIESLIQTATDTASSFGAVESRISTQADFVSKLTDTMKNGIGALVDADMEEASARLQALQTQQQLGIQSLSIANQQPQNILALFK